MKRLILLFVLVSSSVYAQQLDSLKTQRDSLLTNISSKIDEIEYLLEIMHAQSNYKMYGTENIYTLLKLDTQTGKIWQVQWSLDDDKEGTWTINSNDLSYTGSCFELYPTPNMYQFILLDKTYGRTWHVQWGIGDKKRWIKRIY